MKFEGCFVILLCLNETLSIIREICFFGLCVLVVFLIKFQMGKYLAEKEWLKGCNACLY